MEILRQLINESGTWWIRDNETEWYFSDFETDNNPIYMIVTYVCMGIFGVLGNIVTCVVITTNKSMHTVTNCYLINLAVSDLLMLVFAFPPFDGYDKYNNKAVCVLR